LNRHDGFSEMQMQSENLNCQLHLLYKYNSLFRVQRSEPNHYRIRPEKMNTQFGSRQEAAW
jgi:hypothetical protein